jgi:hypothetical protein
MVNTNRNFIESTGVPLQHLCEVYRNDETAAAAFIFILKPTIDEMGPKKKDKKAKKDEEVKVEESGISSCVWSTLNLNPIVIFRNLSRRV